MGLKAAAVGARWAIVLAAVVCFHGSLPRVQAQVPREYDLKAVLLFNFTQFVEWPERAFRQPGSPFVIGILGRDPFGVTLDEIVRNEQCAGRPIRVVRYANAEAARECQMLFISASERERLPRIAAALQDRPVLTVGDFDGFAVRGGMIRLFKGPAGKVQLRIDLNAIKAANLSVSAKLLRVAEAVNPTED